MNPLGLLQSNSNIYDMLLYQQIANNPNKNVEPIQNKDQLLNYLDEKYYKKNSKRKKNEPKNFQKNKKKDIHIEDARVRNSFIGKQESYGEDYATQGHKGDSTSYSETTTKRTETNDENENEQDESSSEEVVFI